MFATIYNIDVTGTQTPDANDDLLAAHIHGPAPAGTNAGVRWGFFGAPDNDNAPDDLIFTPFANGVGGTFSSVWNQGEGNNTTLTAQLENIKGGLSYLNFHTRQFGGGEIRGQIGDDDDRGRVSRTTPGRAGVARDCLPVFPCVMNATSCPASCAQRPRWAGSSALAAWSGGRCGET